MEFIKVHFTKLWYIALLFCSSVYVKMNWLPQSNFTHLSLDMVIKIVWIMLLLFPLFSEIEVGSVKPKREIKMPKVMDVKISSSNTMVVNNSLPFAPEIADAEKTVSLKGNDSKDIEKGTRERAIELFGGRYSIRNLINKLCDKTNYLKMQEKPKSFQEKTLFLVKHKALDYRILGDINYIVNVAKRGIAGEIISDYYYLYYKAKFPVVEERLKTLVGHCEGEDMVTCTRCQYSGKTRGLYCPFCDAPPYEG